MRLSGDNMLLKNSLKKIKKSFGRYLSLVLIIFIGVGFYTGIIESIPNIKRVQTEFYNEKNAMDIKVLSTLGFNKEDIKALKEVEDITTVVGSYSLDTLVSDEVVRVHAIEEKINKPLLRSGKMPTKDNECLADDNNYKVGDIINQGASNVYKANVEENKDNERYINWYFGSQTEKKFKGIKVVSSSPESSLGARKDSVWKDIKNYTFNAELTVVGTYSNMYAPGNFIDIVLKNKNGLIHYATGRYMIIQIDDNVSTSEFTQTMKLIKNTGNTTSSTIYKLNMQQTVNEETNTNTGTTAYTPVYGPTYTKEEFSDRTQTPVYRQVNNTLPNNISMGRR